MNKTPGSKKFFSSKSFALIIVLILIIVAFGILNPNFLKYANLRNIMYSTSLAGIICVGVCCVLISGNADLSVGAVGCMGGIICGFCLRANIPWVISVVITLMFGASAGIINALLLNKLKIPPFIGTLAMTSVWQGVGNLMTSNVNIPITNTSFSNVGAANIFLIPLPFIIMLVLMSIYGIMLSSSEFGRRIYMIGGNRQAARLAGINPEKMNIILFLNCSAVSAFSGAILAARMRTASPLAVQGTQFTAITALVLGGVAFGGGSGGMFGGFIGLLLLNTFNNGLMLIGLGSYWQIAASGVLLVLALTVDYFNERARRVKFSGHTV